jgi:uncharacterized membrane protein YhhN
MNGPARPPALFAVLWFAWAALLAAAMILGIQLDHSSAAATCARMGSSLVLVAAGWLAFALFRRTGAGRFALLIALGMTLGAIGDFFNAGLLGFVPLPDPVLGGIAAFGLGHVAYIAGCLEFMQRAQIKAAATRLAGLAAWEIVGLVGWYFVAFRGSEARDLVWPGLPYTLLLAGTAGVASGLAMADRRLLPLAAGAALFFVSDLILAWGLFRGGVPHQTEAVWLTYGPGQMLIVFSTLAAARVVTR